MRTGGKGGDGGGGGFQFPGVWIQMSEVVDLSLARTFGLSVTKNVSFPCTDM